MPLLRMTSIIEAFNPSLYALTPKPGYPLDTDLSEEA